MRAIVLSLLAWMFLVPTRATAVPEHNLLWMRTYDSPAHDNDKAEAVAVDAAGNIYVAGWSRRPDLGENHNILLIKYSPDGTMIWTRKHNSFPDGADYGLGVAVGGDGSIFVVGAVDTSTNKLDGWLRKYDASGAVVTSFGAGGTVTYNSVADSQDIFYGVAVAEDGSVYVAGTERRSDVGEDGNWLVVKYSATGSLIWTRTHNGIASLWDEALGIAVEPKPNGDVVVVGYETLQDSGPALVNGLRRRRAALLDTDRDLQFNTDIVVRRYASGGQLVWKTSYGSDVYEPDGTLDAAKMAQDVAYDVVVDAAGSVYVVGTVEVGPAKDPTEFDRWLRRYSADGLTAIWTRRVALIACPDCPADVAKGCAAGPTAASADRLFVAGASRRKDLAQGLNLTAELYDQPTGLPIRAQVYDSGNFPQHLDEVGEDIAVDSEGNYIVVGWEETQAALNQGTNWVIRKYAGPPVIPIDLSNLQVYPNPFRPASAVGGVVKFGNVPLTAVVRIYTVRGYLVRELRAPFEWDGLNDQGLPVATGVYFYVVKEGGKAPVRGKMVLVR